MTTAYEPLQLAVKYHQTNHLKQAEQLYCQVLETQPDHPEALYGLGVLNQQFGRLQDAERFLSTAQKAQPESVKVWFSLGNLHLSRGQLKEAEFAYQQAINLKPDAAPFYNNLGYCLQQQGQLDEAIASYEKALELQPDCVEADVNLGNILHMQGKLSKEEQLNYAQLNYTLGIAREKVGDLKTAEAYLLKAVELNSSNGEFYLNLGKIYQQQKNLQQAAVAYREGLKLLNPRYAEAFVANHDRAVAETAPVTPPIPTGEVTVGDYNFPRIAALVDNEQPRPFWSVVIPVYNRSDYLLEALASVLVQWPGQEEMEILVLDNASTPPLFDLVNSIGKGVVKYYRHPENLGVVRNANAGIALSRGEWIHILHDDDCVFPDFYSRLEQSLKNCPKSVGSAFTGFNYIDEKGKKVATGDIVLAYGDNRGILKDWLQQTGVCGLITVPAVVVKRTTHEHLGGYDPAIQGINEWEMYKRIAVFYDCWYEPEILAGYRVHSQRETSNNWLSGSLPKAIRGAIEITDSYLPIEYRAEITEKARWQNFNYCMNHAIVPLKAGNITATLRIIQEALKIDSSSKAIAKLFAWLNQDETIELRKAIVSHLFLNND